MKLSGHVWVVMFVALAGMLCGIGCETSDNPKTDGVETYFDENPIEPGSHGSLPGVTLIVTAETTVLSNPGEKTVVTANGGTPPYNWAVDNAGMGNVSPATGGSVVYTRSGIIGFNAVTVVDSRGGSARVVIQSK